DPCISVTGTVEEVRKEADGDVHILFRLDQQYESLLNEKNISRQQGDLVLEPICQGKIRQADAEEPCSRYNGPYYEPQIGQRYLVSGAYVHDAACLSWLVRLGLVGTSCPDLPGGVQRRVRLRTADISDSASILRRRTACRSVGTDSVA